MQRLPRDVKLGIATGLGLAVLILGAIWASHESASAAETVASGLADGTVTTARIADNAVTAAKIAAAVAGDGLSGGAGAALDVDVSDFAGAGLEDDGAENLRIAAAAAGDGLSGGAGSALAVGVDGATIEINADALRVKDAGITAAKIAAAVAGDGLAGGGGAALSVNVDDSSIEINADALRVKASGVTDAMLAGSITRAKLAEDSLAVYQVPLMTCRRPNGAYLQDDSAYDSESYGIVADVWGSGTLYLKGSAAVDNTKTSTLCFEFAVPPEYVADADVKLIVHCRYTGSGTPGTCTVDAEVYELGHDGTVGADLNATAAQAISGSFADYTFTVTDTNLSGGDRLMVAVRMSVQETGASDPLHAEMGGIRMQLDIKG